MLWVGLQYRPNRSRILGGQNDFMQFYAAAQLCCDESMYSIALNRELQQVFTGGSFDGISYTRPPFYAVLLRPLALLPFSAAYLLFQAASLAAAIGAVALLCARSQDSVFLALGSVPLLLTFVNGQDTAILLLILSAGVAAYRKGWRIAAGAVFSLALIKPHLVLFVPLALLLHREWRALAGFCGGGAVLGVIGAGALPAFIHAALAPEMNLIPDRMISSAAILACFGISGLAPKLAVLAATGIIAAVAVSKSDGFVTALVPAILAGIFAAPHAYPQDGTVLLIAGALSSGPLSWLLLALNSAPFYLLTNAGAPWSASLPLLTAATLVFSIHEHRNRAQARRTAA